MVEPNADELAAFQAALLELLAEGLPLENVMERLRSDAAFGPFAAYVGQFDPRMVEVAALLVAKWGRRGGHEEGACVGER